MPTHYAVGCQTVTQHVTVLLELADAIVALQMPRFGTVYLSRFGVHSNHEVSRMRRVWSDWFRLNRRAVRLLQVVGLLDVLSTMRRWVGGR